VGAACVFDGNDWICRCPAAGEPAPPNPGAGVRPAYKVRFVVPLGGAPAGVIRVESVGCPKLDAACLDFASAEGAEGRARMSTLVALYSSARTTPSAALTARTTIDVPGATITAANGWLGTTTTLGTGIAVRAGTSISGGLTATGIAGTPTGATLAPDTALSGIVAASPLLPTDGDRMFASTFGLAPETWRTQPAAFVVGSCPCSAAAVRSAVSVNPGRPIWVDGDLALDSAGDIGSAAEPVTLVVNGSLTAPTAGATIWGLVYSRAPTWTISGSATVRGAAIAENAFAGTGSWNFVFDADVLSRLRMVDGSFVPVPGSWKDYTQ
jgi:hypothetical protein